MTLALCICLAAYGVYFFGAATILNRPVHALHFLFIALLAFAVSGLVAAHGGYVRAGLGGVFGLLCLFVFVHYRRESV